MLPGELRTWIGDEGVVHVGFDDSGNVLWKRFVKVGRLNPGFVELFQWRFERWRDRTFGAST
jgi:hypothetical protein